MSEYCRDCERLSDECDALSKDNNRLNEEVAALEAAQLQDWSSEGFKDYRIDNLEKALDWAMVAVLDNYDSGECGKDEHDELKASLDRIQKWCAEKSAAQQSAKACESQGK